MRDHHKISDSATQFSGQLVGATGFGSGLAALGDADGDGTPDLAVGLVSEPGFGGEPKSAFWTLRLHAATWSDLGGGFGPAPGADAPRLTGVGTLLPGAPLTVALESRLPDAPALLVLGPAFLGAPLAFGVLGPVPQLILPVFTDGDGALTLQDRWPPSTPPGATLYLQAWLLDGHGAVAASGSLQATAP